MGSPFDANLGGLGGGPSSPFSANELIDLWQTRDDPAATQNKVVSSVDDTGGWLDRLLGITQSPMNASGGIGGGTLASYLSSNLAASQAGGINPFMQVGQASDVSNMNPYTADIYGQMSGAFGNAMQQAFAGGIEGTPQQTVNQGLMSLLGGDVNNPLAAPAFRVADMMGERAVQDVANLYSSGNALYSGAAAQSATQASQEARNQSILSYINQLGGLSQGYQQTGMQGLGTFSNILGGLGAQNYYTPSYVTNPNFISPLDYYALQSGIQARNQTNVMGSMAGGFNFLGALLGMGG